MQSDQDNPRTAHEVAPAESDGVPKFGKLLIVLAFAVAIVVALTYGSMLYYTN
tara:strand:+ start:316291 stop:316449 length:159 start_codon:yes stop_codon:yes gene_type:complete